MTVEELEKKVEDLEVTIGMMTFAQKKTWEVISELINNITKDNTTANQNSKNINETINKLVNSHNELTQAFNKHVLEHRFNEGMNNYLSAEGFDD